jgi:hypothetical protein
MIAFIKKETVKHIIGRECKTYQKKGKNGDNIVLVIKVIQIKW